LPVADNNAILKRRVDDYLWRDKSSTVTKLRGLLNEHFTSFDRVAIVGGMIRDLARAGKRGFKSDVDLVVDAPTWEVAKLAERLNAKINRFGGYSYSTDHWKVDFWALHSTWAHRERHRIIYRLEDVIFCTFFDCDAVIYDLKHRQIITGSNYLDKLRNRTIDINLAETPSINGNLLRAVRRILLWDLEPGPLLRSFIMQHLSDTSLAEMARVDRALYVHSLVSKFSSAEGLREQIGSRERRSQLATWYAHQLALPGMFAPDREMLTKNE
jgi:hypothetical protein